MTESDSSKSTPAWPREVQTGGSTLTFRRALPEDAPWVVPLIHDSSRTLIDRSFRVGGADPGAFLERDFRRGEGIFGHLHQWVLVDAQGRVVCTTTAYRGDAYPSMVRATLRSALGHFTPLSLVRVLFRSLVLGRLFTPPRHDGVFVANACTVAPMRSRGLWAVLLEHALLAVASEHTRVVELDVSSDNPRAEALYQRLGFVVESERSRGEGDTRLGFRRMARPYAPAWRGEQARVG